MDNAFAQRFGREWVSAWNSHDLDVILAHYADDFVMTSPVIIQLANEPSGALTGKKAVAAYWSLALEKYPDLHFNFLHAFAGVDSVVVHYQGHRGLSAEVFFFDQDSLVTRAYAHYQ